MHRLTHPRPLALVLALALLLAAWPLSTPADNGTPLSRELKQLQDQLARLRADRPQDTADADVFAKGVLWALRDEGKLEARDRELVQAALRRGRQRADALDAGQRPWDQKRGRLVRGFVSAIDGSIQPFGLIVPARYDPRKPMRLDVVLHGSSKPVVASELRFMMPFDDGDTGGPPAPEADFIELHPLGRVENGYRWAGETDVFEAIEAVASHYAIDRRRIVLRGMSMGASGTWHLGLKHPDRFVALGPYCGYVDTHHFSETPLPTFVKVGPLPAHQERMLHLLDSVDYAANAGVVPAIACMGEKDVFFQAHVLMGAAMQREGLTMVNLISPGTGHVVDPVTFAEQMRRIAPLAEAGRPLAPRSLRFVTWTLKYSQCEWLQVLGLGEHYSRAELEARVADDGTVEVREPKNITRFAIRPPMLQTADAKLRVGGTAVALPAPGNTPRTVVLARQGEQWAVAADAAEPAPPGRKRPGVQGPIDDAFTTPFLCVRGTGTAWHPGVQKWSEANLQRFADEWQRFFRGTLPIKDDTAVTEEDVRRCNLILFGDPSSNSWIGKVLPHLPITWTRDECRLGTQRYPAASHAPALIYPNPLPGAAGRYVVLNSGHTFTNASWAP